MGSEEEKTIRLRGSDGEAFEVSQKVVVAASSTIKGKIEEGLAAGVVELPNLTAATLSRVLEHVNKHLDAGIIPPADNPSFFAPNDDDPLARFDEDLVRVDNDALVDLVGAANFFNIDGLVELACKAVADQMRGRTIDEIREKFSIVNDYTKEEEEEVRRENSWAFE